MLMVHPASKLFLLRLAPQAIMHLFHSQKGNNKLICLQDYMLVKFGNNWIPKIPRTAKLDSAYGLVQFWPSTVFSSSNYFQIGQHLLLLHNTNYIASKLYIYMKKCLTLQIRENENTQHF